MLKLEKNTYYDNYTQEFVLLDENNVVVKRVPRSKLEQGLTTDEYSTEYGHYGENNGPVGETK